MVSNEISTKLQSANSKDVEHDDGFIGMATKKQGNKMRRRRRRRWRGKKAKLIPFFTHDDGDIGVDDYDI
uniref:Uncharacterized protein n=1 Tax=Tetranychus urticae TaxID=32264 RepID=T1KF21_TETUR